MGLGPPLLWAFVLFAALAVLIPRMRFLLLSVVAGSAALGRLAAAFLANDWSSEYVADNSRSGLSPLIRMAGLWAGPEGSLLLFAVMVAVAAAVGGYLSPAANRRATVRLGAGVTFGFATVVLAAAPPFVRLPIPAIDGLGLQPVLEHPAMVWHPPLLYSGLVGLLVPAFMAAGKAIGGARPALPRYVFAIPLALLGAGLATGARWAHVELGWGGYWAWDPIESAGLVAWLVGAAALHLRRSGSDRQLALFCIVPGVATIWATTLTRVGLIGSVHSFGNSPSLRVGMLILAAAGTAALLGPVAFLGASSGVGETSNRRWATAILFGAGVVVALGTYEPLVEAAIGGDTVAIAGRYFSRTTWPLVVLGGIVAVRADRAGWLAAAGAAAAVLIVPWSAGAFALAVAAVGGAVIASSLGAGRQRGRLAHIGLGILLIGVAGTMAATVERVILYRDIPAQAAGLELTHRGMELVERDVASEAIATVDVGDQRLQPSLVQHTLRGIATAEVATRMSLMSEVQLVLLNGGDESASYRVVHTPRLMFVWLGAAVMVVGLVFPQFGRRRLRAKSRLTVESESASVSGLESASGDGLVLGGAVGGAAAGGAVVGGSPGGADLTEGSR